MFTCFACRVGKQLQFAESTAFLAHLQFFHSNLLLGGKLVCTHTDCYRREFDRFNSFRKHVKGHKSAAQCIPTSNTKHANHSECHPDLEVPHESFSVHENVYEKNEVNFPENDVLKFDGALTSSIVTFIATMYDIGLTETQVQNLIDSQIQLWGGAFLPILQESVLNIFKKCNVPEKDSNNISKMFTSLINMFDGFQTTYLRLKEFQNCGAFIPPQPFTTGTALSEKNVDGEVIIEPITLSGQFIPMRMVLKGFLELPDVLKSILEYMQKLEADSSGVMENIIQGKLWREKIKPKFEGKVVLPLNFFYDDYETNKALGAHAGVYNLGAGYVRLPCLPPKFQGALQNIFLCILFHSTDKYFGKEKIFRKVVDEFLFLESTGISVVSAEGTTQVFFALCVAGGDNKGANEILGYVQGFTANYYCRICCMRKGDAAKCTHSDPDKLRTPESYVNDLRIDNASLTGRKGVCVFNELLSFHVHENFHLDPMHDWDEGVWKYAMTDIIRYFIRKGRCKLEYLNELIQGFNFGPNEERNKPPLILSDHLKSGSNLVGSASEMRCLVRYFGLIIGHVVEECDKDVWNLYLTARKIVDIVTAPRMTQSDPVILKDLISYHHTEYMRLFKKDLKPKFHFCTHVPEIVSLLGPLEPLSLIRIEAKHKDGVEVARKSNNRVNLPFTVASRHQLEFAFRLLSGRGLASKFECGKVQRHALHSISNYSEFIDVIPLHYPRDFWTTVKWVATNGMKYMEKTVLVLSVIDGQPSFGCIHVISVRGNDVSFVVRCLQCVQFDEHVHAFEVQHSNEWRFVSISDLHTHVVSNIRFGGNGKKYVPFRFSLSHC